MKKYYISAALILIGNYLGFVFNDNYIADNMIIQLSAISAVFLVEWSLEE